jgi:hypothetical protein
MDLVFSDSAKRELEGLPQDLKTLFLKHLEKMLLKTPQKHMKHGIPCHVEKVTKQARIVYHIKGDMINILHCFEGHKEYERWYKSYK